MDLYACLKDLFEALNESHINYCIIRDFESTEQVNNSSDIDVVIKRSNRKDARGLLRSLGWRTPSVNLNVYGHEAFYKWNGSKMLQLDVLWDIYYADGKYKLKDQDEIYKGMGKLGQANIPNNFMAIKMLVLHLLYDKNDVSQKNLQQLRRLLQIYNGDNDVTVSIARSIVNKGKIDDELRGKSWADIGKAGLLQLRISVFNKPFRKIKYLAHYVKTRFTLSRLFKIKGDPFKVAIIGVDGGGKSTTISQLQKMYPDSTVQYMGFRVNSYESYYAKNWISYEHKNGIYQKIKKHLKNYFAFVYEGYYRYWKAVHSGSSIVFFDRYYWEKYDEVTWPLDRFVYFIFCKLLYPKPNLVFYVHCPIEESLRRKDDIDDVEGFIRTKKKWDSIYLNKKGVVALDTSRLSTDEVCGIIKEYITTY